MPAIITEYVLTAQPALGEPTDSVPDTANTPVPNSDR